MGNSACEVSFELSNGATIRARHLDRGGETIVFLPGLGCSMKYYDCIWNDRSLKEVSLLAVDHLGFGISDKPEYFDYKLEHHAENLIRLLLRLGIEHYHLVGHSMGGAIAVLLLEESEVDSFVNVEGNLTELDGALVSRKTAAVPEQTFVDHDFDELKREFPDFPDGYFSLSKASPRGFYRSACSLVEWSASEKLLARYKAFTGPKCYMFGDKNFDAPSLPFLHGIDTISVSGSGHFPMVDNPNEFCQLVSQFLERETIHTGP